MNPASDTPAEPSLKDGFLLSGLHVEPETGRVIGPGGHESLDPKVMGVLVLLAQQAGQVVRRDDLIARLWPGGTATDDALSRCVYELRRQLSRAGKDDRLKALIETVPKRGYRLRGEITAVPAPVAKDNRKWPIGLVLTIAIAATAAIALWFTSGRQPTESAAEPPAAGAPLASIAVLPFVDMSADKSQEYLADGISEEILNRLSQVEDLLVIARTSSFAFRGESMDIREIARQLDVSHVLEGSVRKSGATIRITAQLIAAADNSHLWSETFERELGDLFAVQDDIAASVATALQVTLAGGKAHGRMPAIVSAHESYLQGQFFYHRRGPGDLELAARYYEEAIAADPGYARAWAALAGAYSLLRLQNPQDAAAMQEKQGLAALKAVELDPDLAVAHARLAHFYFAKRDVEAGRRHRQRAAMLDPNDLLVLGGVAMDAIQRGRFDEAIDAWRKSVALDPRAAPARMNLAITLAADGQYEEALVEFRRVLEVSPNIGWHIHGEIVRLLVVLRRYDEALSVMAGMPPNHYRDHGLAMLHGLPAHRADAAAALQRLEAAPREDSRDMIWLADTYTYLGMHEEAFALLQDWKKELASLPDDRSQLNSYLQELLIAPFLKPLHADPRWAELLSERDTLAKR